MIIGWGTCFLRAWSVPWISKTHARQNETLWILQIHTRRVSGRNTGQFYGNSLGGLGLCHCAFVTLAVEFREYISRHGKAVATQISYFECLMELCCMPIQRFGLNTGSTRQGRVVHGLFDLRKSPHTRVVLFVHPGPQAQPMLLLDDVNRCPLKHSYTCLKVWSSSRGRKKDAFIPPCFFTC